MRGWGHEDVMLSMRISTTRRESTEVWRETTSQLKEYFLVLSIEGSISLRFVKIS